MLPLIPHRSSTTPRDSPTSMRWGPSKSASIVIHNLDYGDNGTFTCDVKNPPDIVGKTSQVTLYVFEKGVRGGGTGVWEAVQRGDQAWLRVWGKGQNAQANAPQALGQWAEGSLVGIS